MPKLYNKARVRAVPTVSHRPKRHGYLSVVLKAARRFVYSVRLSEALEHPDTRTEASEALRGLIDAIVLTQDHGELRIELKGNLAAMLGAAQNAKRSPETGDLSLQVVMVAGAHLALSRRLCWTAA